MSKSKTKGRIKLAVPKSKNASHPAVKTKAQGDGLPTPKRGSGAALVEKPLDESKLSKPVQAGLAAVASMKPTNNAPARETKLTKVIELLRRPEGATVDDIMDATGWQKHTVRAAISHALGKKRGYKIVSNKPKDGKRTYKITEPEQ